MPTNRTAAPFINNDLAGQVKKLAQGTVSDSDTDSPASAMRLRQVLIYHIIRYPAPLSGKLTTMAGSIGHAKLH